MMIFWDSSTGLVYFDIQAGDIAPGQCIVIQVTDMRVEMKTQGAA